MSRIGYIFDRLIKMDYKKLFETVNTVHKICGKNRIYIFFDIIVCGFKYGAGYSDYLLCEFYNLDAKLRATYITRGVNNSLVARLNDRNYYLFFDNKLDFYRTFKDFIGRDWLDMTKASAEDFKSFMENRNEIITKPNSESCGNGVEKLIKSDFKSLDDMLAKLKQLNSSIVEDVVTQCDEMASINPGSVNTLRIVTILNDDGPHIVYAYIRIGNSDRPVDNLNAGGMCAPIDLETGVIQYPAYDKARHVYVNHPKTGQKIQGFKIPWWKESAAMCEKAALIIPQMKYVGWDVAVTKDGPLFIEGNNHPGYDILQLPPHIPQNKVGMLPRFRMFVSGI